MLLSTLIKDSDNVIISTGNVLNDIRKKAGLKPSEELLDCLKSTLNDPEIQKNEEGSQHLLQRKSDDLLEKIQEHERNSIKIGAKIFLNNYSENCLTDAIEKLFDTVSIDCLDNVILAYHPRSEDLTNGSTAEPHMNGEIKEGVIEWGIGSCNAPSNLKKLWATLERYAQSNKICQLGIADLDVETLKDLYENSTIRPAITQINLSACCVVPPALKEFCNQKEIQLLTHSDPQVILPQESLSEISIENYHAAWSVRYQVHIKCRGVLAAKGFIVKLKHN